ncbi:MAG: hypothetical protein ABI699_09285 [Caldimonas sp.]
MLFSTACPSPMQGLAAIVLLPDGAFVVQVAGAARDDPIRALGLVRRLERELSGLVDDLDLERVRAEEEIR